MFVKASNGIHGVGTTAVLKKTFYPTNYLIMFCEIDIVYIYLLFA